MENKHLALPVAKFSKHFETLIILTSGPRYVTLETGDVR